MWDIKYRPLTFADVLGQEGSVRLLKARLHNKAAQDTSYIFSGSHGQGKTTLSRILARALLCQDMNLDDPEPCNKCDNCLAILNETSNLFIEMDAASKGTIDNIRSLVDDLAYTTFGGFTRVHLFDECFTEDTLLWTRQGFRSIRDIVEAKESIVVLSYDTSKEKVVWRQVTDWFDLEGLREVLCLELDNGVEITVTPDQEVYTHNRGWIKAQDITENDDIMEVPCPQPK